MVEVQPAARPRAGWTGTRRRDRGLDQDTVTGIDDIARVLDGGKIGKRVSVRILRDAARILSLELVPSER